MSSPEKLVIIEAAQKHIDSLQVRKRLEAKLIFIKEKQ